MVGKFAAANAESFERKKKRRREEVQDEAPKRGPSQKHLMVPIEYHDTGAEKYAWEKVEVDSKLFGPNADMSGFFGLEKISGDEADKLLMEFGKTTTTAKKKKKAKVLQLKDAQVDESEPKQKKRKKVPNPANEDGEKEGGDMQAQTEKPAAKKKQAKDKKLASKKRKSEHHAADEMEGDVADGADEDDVVGLEDEEAATGAPEEAEPAAAAARDQDYDDEYEYGDWGGIMLRQCLVKALDDLGFTQPTPIQQAVVPVAMSKRGDVFGAAETGSGKTLAFGLPMLQRILDSHSFSGIDASERNLAGLVISPTRELALQVRDHIAAAAKYTPIKVVAVVGGLAVQKQERQLATHPHIVVGTPGRLWEQIQHGGGYLSRLHMLLCLVVDEADRMLETGHFQELENILSLLPVVDPNKRTKRREEEKASKAASKLAKKGGKGKGKGKEAKPTESEEEWTEEEEEEEGLDGLSTFRAGEAKKKEEEWDAKHRERHYRRQTLIFSATLIKDVVWRGQSKQKKKKGKADEDKSKDQLKVESVNRLVKRLQLPDEPTIIDLSPSGRVSEKIEQQRLECVATDKDLHVYLALVQHLNAGGGRSMVFTNAIGEARRLAGILNLLRVRSVLLHSGLQQRQRLKNLDVFKGDRSCVLIATDVAARGLDIPLVEFVIHYHVPKVPSVYVHRCGRTARGTVMAGKSLMVMSPAEQWQYAKICDVIGDEIPSIDPAGPFLAQAEKRVVTAKKLEAEMNKASKEARDKAWMSKQAELLDVDIDEEELDEEDRLMVASANRAHGSGMDSRRVLQLQQTLSELLDAHMLPKGVSPRFVAGGAGDAQQGLPELMSHGAVNGSLRRGYANGRRVHRKKAKPLGKRK